VKVHRFFLNIFIEVTKLQPPPTKSETFPAYDTHNGPCHDGERPLHRLFFFKIKMDNNLTTQDNLKELPAKEQGSVEF
jgi:hypothetical protein